MAKTVRPFHRNSPARGLRLAFQAALPGSIRPGENVSAGAPPADVTDVPAVDVPPGRSTKDSPRSVRYRKTCRMLPPGWPPSASLTGSISRHVYAGPPARVMAAVRLDSVTFAATVPLSVGPLLSWISSTATRSGAARLVTIMPASRSNLLCGSAGDRFSTLNVATASCPAPAGVVTSGTSPPLVTAGVAVTARWKSPNA